MRRSAIGMLAVGVAIVLAGCTDETAGDEETLTLSESDKRGTFTPIGEASENSTPPGSGFAFSVPLLDSSQQVVGELNAVCTATKPGPRLLGTCSGTAKVPEGQLALNVGGDIGENITGAIVGGTGKYAGATGTFTSRSSGEGSEDAFEITLP
jgi:hypothetical protein